MDYSIDKVYDQFINLNLKIEKFNEDEKIISSTNKIFSYDLFQYLYFSYHIHYIYHICYLYL